MEVFYHLRLLPYQKERVCNRAKGDCIPKIGNNKLGNARSKQDGDVNFVVSNNAESGYPNGQETRIVSTYMQPTLTMTLAIPSRVYSVCVRPATAGMTIAIE